MADALDRNWEGVKAVIFDVDGTLYAQAPLRRKMLLDLIGYYGLRPWRVGELLLLRRFRAEREKHASAAAQNLESAQYEWCAHATGYSVQQVRRVVEQWIFRHPTQYLAGCTYPGTHAFFAALRANGIKIGIYSDYPAHEKLAAMGLQADVVISSTDPEVNAFKPDSRGLRHLAAQFGLAPEDCLFIGDRPELDGACAAQAAMPFLLVENQPFADFTFFHRLHRSFFDHSLRAHSHEPHVLLT